jgi:hypothetical protein
MLELLVLILDRTFQPVLAVKIHNDPALVEPVVAPGEIRFDRKIEELFISPGLQNRRIVVSEMIIRPLPQVCMRLSSDPYLTAAYLIIARHPGPFKVIQFHSEIPLHILFVTDCQSMPCA